MKLLETKEQLTLNELLRIAYEYGNDSADMPADAETVDSEFSEWIETATPLFKKLIIPRVSGSAFDIKEVELFHFAIIKALPHTNKKTNGYAAMIKTRDKLAGLIKEHYR